MKKLILLFSALCLISCSDDDGADANKPRTLFVESAFVSNASGSGGGAIEFSYNDEKQLNTVLVSGTLCKMTYKDGKMIAMETSAGGVAGDAYEFGYDDDGILESLKAGNADPYDVTYDSDEKKYTIAAMDRSFALNDDNDITAITIGTQEVFFTYDDKGKGPMYDVKGDFYMAAFILTTPFIMSKRPALEFQGFTSENILNADGYLSKSLLSVQDAEKPSTTIYYSYTTL